MVLMTKNAKSTARAGERGVNREAPGNDPTKLPAQSDDVVARKRAVLANFLAQSFPECLSEGRIDIESLRNALGDRVAGGTERFGLVWPGKTQCMRVIQEPSTATLQPDRGESLDFDAASNVFIEGDNLEVLKLLQKSYFGKVKMIYIDPPYNTGHEFIYRDKYTESLETYLAYTGQIDSEARRFSTNTDTVGRYHSNWLNMMYPRLYLARNLLRDDGAIFVSIDDHELSRLREICDQVFGEENFKADIAWQKRYTRSNNTVDFTTVVEHVLVYGKSEAFEVNLLPRTEEADARYSNPDGDPRGDWKGASFLNPAAPQARPNLCYPLENPNTGGWFTLRPTPGGDRGRCSRSSLPTTDCTGGRTARRPFRRSRCSFPKPEGSRPRTSGPTTTRATPTREPGISSPLFQARYSITRSRCGSSGGCWSMRATAPETSCWTFSPAPVRRHRR